MSVPSKLVVAVSVIGLAASKENKKQNNLSCLGRMLKIISLFLKVIKDRTCIYHIELTCFKLIIKERMWFN